MMKALLFINGEPPKNLPNFNEFDIIGCTDGAFYYFEEKKSELEKLSFVSGDFDSHSEQEKMKSQAKIYDFEIIVTPDQNKTDFEKSLEILLEKNVTQVYVYGASGKESDHFLGNLSVALKFHKRLDLKFIDDYCKFYFSKKNEKITNCRGKIISLYPFPVTEKITTKGLKWELEGATLDVAGMISTRNLAVEDNVELNFEHGNLIIFINKNSEN